MNFRLAEERDLDGVCAMVDSAVEELRRSGIDQWDAVYPAREDFLSDLRGGRLYVGFPEGEDVCAAVFAVSRDCDAQYSRGLWKHPESGCRVLHRLCVHPGYWRRGIAREALAYAEGEMRRAGAESVRLDVFSGNPAALALYRGSGYETVGTAVWRKGLFFLMEKHLMKKHLTEKHPGTGYPGEEAARAPSLPAGEERSACGTE